MKASELVRRPVAVEPESGDVGLWLERLPRWAGMLVVLVVVLALWQAVFSLRLLPAIILPSPGETFRELWTVGVNLATGGYMLEALWITTQEVVLGFLLAVAVGFVLGVLVGESSLGQRVIMPYLVAINAMPKVAFAPVFIAWLGFGVQSKVAMAAFIAFFPVIVDTAAGMFAASHHSLQLFRSMGATRWQTLVKLKLPTALPYIFAGLKTAAVFSVVGAVVGEFLGGGRGFGELIRVASTQLRIARVFALIFYLSFLGLALYGSVSWVQRRIVFWQREEIVDLSSS